jgi:hypothetical protein
MNSQVSDRANHILYKTYYSLMMGDILHKLGYSPTKKHKEILHDFHKRIFGYKTISGLSHEALSHFLFDVVVFWASEKGFFIRTKRNQPYDIENRPFSEVKDLL